MAKNEFGLNRTRNIYGWSLLACHFVIWLFFLKTRWLVFVTAQVEPFCWPYFKSCWQWRLPSYGAARALLLVYLFSILTTAVALWCKRYRLFTVLLVLMNVGLFAFISLDYRLRTNEFYMLFWIQAVFLLNSHPRWTIPLAIVSCYFGAGFLKLNYEWISGAVLYAPLWGIPYVWSFPLEP